MADKIELNQCRKVVFEKAFVFDLHCTLGTNIDELSSTIALKLQNLTCSRTLKLLKDTYGLR